MKAAFPFLARSLLCVLGLLCLGGALLAQDYTVTRTVFIPTVYYVGDEVELRIALRSDFATKMKEPQAVTQPNWGSLGSIRLHPRDEGVELRVKFTCFVAGTHSLPAINLGPVVLEGINIFVTSLAPPNGALEPLREPAVLPGTWLRVVLQVLVVLLVPALLALGWFLGWPRLRRFQEQRREQRPYRQLARSLQSGRSQLGALNPAGFYLWLLGEVRQYLAERWQAPVLAATSTELASLVHRRIHHQETAAALVEVFARGDRVKFAGEPASPASCLADLALLESAMAHVEQEERMRKQGQALDESAQKEVADARV